MRRSDHPLYETWKSMRQRCNNPRHIFYYAYGGRGIKVCERWDDFSLFVQDVGERPDGHTLDRRKQNLSYEPGNIKWSTVTQQNCNRRTCRFIKVKGATKALSEVARDYNINPSTLKGRLNRGMKLEEALR